MKKLTSIILTLTLLLSVIVVPVYADDNVQTVWGQITGWAKDTLGIKYTISTETEPNIEAYAADGVSITLHAYAFYHIETRSDGEKYITGYETIPEYGYEIGYLARVYKQRDGSVYIELYTDKKENMLMYTVRINGGRYRDDELITQLTPQVGNFIAYKLDEDGDIKYIDFIDIKTPQEKYKLNSDTKFFIKTGSYYQISNLPDGYNYSYEVLSYDENYNARAVKVTELYKNDIAFYSHTLRRTKSDIALVNTDGTWKIFDFSEDCIISDTVTAENFDGVVEYKINAEDEIMEITALAGSDFDGYTVKDGKIGENTIEDTAIFDVIDNGREEHIHKWTFSKFSASDKLQYSGKAFTSSSGKRILWITGSGLAEGNPVVNFWAKAFMNGENSRFRVGATYKKQGYAGSGTIYLAVYHKGSLYSIYTYKLTNKESAYDEDGELKSVIWETVLEGEIANIKDYTVKGFVWYDNLSPMYPAVPVNVEIY